MLVTSVHNIILCCYIHNSKLISLPRPWFSISSVFYTALSTLPIARFYHATTCVCTHCTKSKRISISYSAQFPVFSWSSCSPLSSMWYPISCRFTCINPVLLVPLLVISAYCHQFSMCPYSIFKSPHIPLVYTWPVQVSHNNNTCMHECSKN